MLSRIVPFDNTPDTQVHDLKESWIEGEPKALPGSFFSQPYISGIRYHCFHHHLHLTYLLLPLMNILSCSRILSLHAFPLDEKLLSYPLYCCYSQFISHNPLLCLKGLWVLTFKDWIVYPVLPSGSQLGLNSGMHHQQEIGEKEGDSRETLALFSPCFAIMAWQCVPPLSTLPPPPHIHTYFTDSSLPCPLASGVRVASCY